MSFGFFIVAALDLLGALDTVVTEVERRSWTEWIYTCQVAHTGGFRGFTGTMVGGLRSVHNWHWDPANLPHTYFALATLIILGDDLGRVKRRECLTWVNSLQRPNGSFGELLGEDDEIEGADDPRHCMCAMGILKILQGEGNGVEPKMDFDDLGLRRYIANCQSVEGGIGQGPLLEAHSGLNYCGIAALSFLGLLEVPPTSIQEVAERSNVDISSCTRWMLERQTTWIDEDDEDSDEDEDQSPTEDLHNNDQPSFDLSSLQVALDPQTAIAGFNGRCGKIADTCYCFWNVGALAVSAFERAAVHD